MKIIKGFTNAKKVLDRSVVRPEINISATLRQKLLDMFGTDEPKEAVRRIIDEVRSKGDAAVYALTLKIDKIKLASLEVPKSEILSAYDKVNDELIGALELAAGRIEKFHVMQRNNMCRGLSDDGLGQMVRPLDKVGVYAPGGTAWYPSTVLMTAVPARVAGVKEVVLVTPPGPDRSVPPPTLVAADIAGVDRVFAVGGAQAIAALAYGTESIPAVDKICGPGNIFVVLAKKLVYGTVAIDGLQGPSEIVVVADDTANPVYCAADLLAQSEHDALACPVLITTSMSLAEEVNKQVEEQMATLKRKKIIVESIGHAIIAVVDTIDEAIELANLFAPEHLELMIKDASAHLPKVQNAGCVFIGSLSAVVLGDYVAGPSHVLPTGGTARFSSALNVMDFIKVINTIEISEENLGKLGETAIIMAENEGLEAHARAVGKRLQKEG